MTEIQNIFSNKIKSSPTFLEKKKNQFHIKSVIFFIRMVKGFETFRLEFPVNHNYLLIASSEWVSEELRILQIWNQTEFSNDLKDQCHLSFK